MSAVIQGPRWPVRKIGELLAVEQQAERCWRVNKYLGSMLTFDFGGHVREQDRQGRAFELGSSRLGVRDCAWRVEGGGERFESDDADDQTASALTELFKASVITGCERRSRWTTFRFSNGARLQLDLTNRYAAEPDEFVASLALRGGACFEMSPDGSWELAPASDNPLTVKAA